MSLTSEQIEAAVKWWGNDLRGPAYKNRRDGEVDDKYVMEKGLAAMARPDPPDEKEVELFMDALRDSLENPETFGRLRPTLSVDYGPGKVLSEALEASGLDPGRQYLSIKTNMWFGMDGVQVSHGYGSPKEELVLANVPRQFCGDCDHPTALHLSDGVGDERACRCLICGCITSGFNESNPKVPTDRQDQLIRDFREKRREWLMAPSSDEPTIDEMKQWVCQWEYSPDGGNSTWKSLLDRARSMLDPSTCVPPVGSIIRRKARRISERMHDLKEHIEEGTEHESQ